MGYRVSTTRSGNRLWWREHEAIPADHTDVRPATPEEVALMDKVHAKGAPSLALGWRIQRLLGAASVVALTLASLCGAAVSHEPPTSVRLIQSKPPGSNEVFICQFLLSASRADPKAQWPRAGSDLSVYDNYTGKLIYRLRRGEPFPASKCLNAPDGHTLRVEGSADVIGVGNIP